MEQNELKVLNDYLNITLKKEYKLNDCYKTVYKDRMFSDIEVDPNDTKFSDFSGLGKFMDTSKGYIGPETFTLYTYSFLSMAFICRQAPQSVMELIVVQKQALEEYLSEKYGRTYGITIKLGFDDGEFYKQLPESTAIYTRVVIARKADAMDELYCK